MPSQSPQRHRHLYLAAPETPLRCFYLPLACTCTPCCPNVLPTPQASLFLPLSLYHHSLLHTLVLKPGKRNNIDRPFFTIQPDWCGEGQEVGKAKAKR